MDGPALSEHWLAGLLMVLYTGVLLYNARVGQRQSRSMADYYVGGRNMGGIVVGVSFFATFASTNSYIGHAGKGYEYGLPWMTMPVFIVVFTFLSWSSVAPRLRRFTSHWDALTLPDYLESRFGSARGYLRLAAGLVILFASLLYLIAIFKGAGNLFQVFLGIGYEGAVALTLVIVMLYTSIGGFVSVVRTDVVQGILMVLGSVTIFYFVTDAAGGIGRLPELAVMPDTASLFTWSGGIPFMVLVGIALSGSLKLLVDPRQVSRFYALKDERSVRTGIWVAVVGIALIQLSLFPVGIYSHFLLDAVSDTDMVIPTLVTLGRGLPRHRHCRRRHVFHGQRAPGRGLGPLQGSGGNLPSHRSSIDLDSRRRRRPGGYCRLHRAGAAGWHRGDHHLLRKPLCRVLLSGHSLRAALAPWQRGSGSGLHGGRGCGASGLDALGRQRLPS